MLVNCGKGQPRCIVGMSYGTAVENSVQFLETLSTELHFDPEVPPFTAYPQRTESKPMDKYFGAMFPEALFTVAEM